MPLTPVRAVLDANVLYPFTLRDTLLRVAEAGFFQPLWSEQILEEVSRNLITQHKMTEKQAAHLRTEMEKAFPEAMVEGHGRLIAQMRNHPGDRHVTAAAKKTSAQFIVTSNLRDFRNLPKGIHAVSPDDFLEQTLIAAPEEIMQILQAQADALRKPPCTLEQLLVGLEKSVPRFARTAQAASKQP